MTNALLRHLRFNRATIICVLVLMCGCVTPNLAHSATPMCQCHFSQPPWEAFGTEHACTAVSTKGKTSCEVAFGGTGADASVIKKVTKKTRKEYDDEVYATLVTYFTALQKSDFGFLTSPEFAPKSVWMFMRGGYLRERLTKVDVQKLDDAVRSFMSDYGRKMSDVFRKKGENFTVTVHDAKFSVERRSVAVEFEGIQVITVYLPPE